MATHSCTRPLAFNPLDVPPAQLNNVLDHIAFYSRLNLLLNVWEYPLPFGAPYGARGAPRTDVEKSPYRIAYLGEITTFHKLQVSIMAGHVAVGVAAPAIAGFEAKPSNFQKLAHYDGEVEVKLTWWRPLVEGQLDQTMAAASPQAKAHMIRGSLNSKVLGHLANNVVYDANFWTNPNNIWAALEALYVKPNQAAHALQKLRTLVMSNLQLRKYHTEYMRLCTLATVDPNAPAHLLQFFDGLNNESTRGGLKNQVSDMKERCTQQSFPLVTSAEVYRRCEALISTDTRSDNYENTNGKRPWVPKGIRGVRW
jgi:hypothetical protein